MAFDDFGLSVNGVSPDADGGVFGAGGQEKGVGGVLQGEDLIGVAFED